MLAPGSYSGLTLEFTKIGGATATYDATRGLTVARNSFQNVFDKEIPVEKWSDYEEPEITDGIVSIKVSGQATEFIAGSAFTIGGYDSIYNEDIFGGQIYAVYGDGTEEKIQYDNCEFLSTGLDNYMCFRKPGNYTMTVSYTPEGGDKLSCEYDYTVIPCITKEIAHKGYVGTNYPENTISAMKRAVEADFYASEFDVWLSADGYLLVVHDVQNDEYHDENVLM